MEDWKAFERNLELAFKRERELENEVYELKAKKRSREAIDEMFHKDLEIDKEIKDLEEEISEKEKKLWKLSDFILEKLEERLAHLKRED